VRIQYSIIDTPSDECVSIHAIETPLDVPLITRIDLLDWKCEWGCHWEMKYYIMTY